MKPASVAAVSRRKQRIISAAIVIVVLSLMLIVLVFREKLGISQGVVERLGYPAIWLLCFVGSASIFVPVPGVLAVCWGGMLLWVPLVAVVAGGGEALGELTGYAAGYGGRGLLKGDDLYPKLEGWMSKRGSVVLFMLSVVPNPIFDVAGVAAGALRYPVLKFLGVVLVGKCIKSLGIAYACSLGVEWVLKLINAA